MRPEALREETRRAAAKKAAAGGGPFFSPPGRQGEERAEANGDRRRGLRPCARRRVSPAM